MTTTAAQIAVELLRPIAQVPAHQLEQWSTWIGDARMLIQDRLGDLAELDQDKLDFVVRQAVAARARRTDPDAEQVAVSLGQQTVTKRYQRSGIVIIGDWWALLDPDTGSSGAFSTQPSYEADTTTSTVWATNVAF